MKKIDVQRFKKLFPSFVSITIVAGMALQSFATEMNLEAFVDMETHLAKYHEIDYRIEDIDHYIERTYKFVCTNLKTYGGTGSSVGRSQYFNPYNTTQTYHWSSDPIIDLSAQGYLRFNLIDTINAFGNHSNTQVFEKETPATLLKWRDGIQLYPTTKVYTKITRIFPNTTTASQTSTYRQEIIMGPFKKFPHITSTSYAGAIYTSLQYIHANIQSTNLYYNYNQDNKPSSWNSMSGVIVASSTDKNTTSSYPTNMKWGISTKEDIEDGSYSDRQTMTSTMTTAYVSTVFGVNLSNYDKVWIRSYAETTGNYDIPVSEFNLTSWNNNKSDH